MNDTFEEDRISGYTIRIDRFTCIGTANCVAVAPEVFEMGDDQIVTFVEEPEDIESDRLIEACDICPVEALIATDAEGTQIAP